MIDTNTDFADKLASLFREAGSAHHKAFAATNGDDPEWPTWYAEFLEPKLNSLLSTRWTRSEVVDLILQSEEERLAISPTPAWPEFYAVVFIKELDPANK